MANGINTWEQFDTARKNFKEDQKDGRKAALSQKIADAVDTEISDEKNIIYMAVEWGYGDAARNMHGIKNYEKTKKDALKEIAQGFKKYFGESAPEDQTDFDDKHRAICDIWINKFKDVNPELACYGKAQKIVNMAFKYLYCCEDASNYPKDGKNYFNYFKYCHVPLDSYTLKWFCHEWFYRLTKEEGMAVNEDVMPKWSKIKAYDNEIFSYMFFQGLFYEWYEDEDITPLQAEFIYWPLVK